MDIMCCKEIIKHSKKAVHIKKEAYAIAPVKSILLRLLVNHDSSREASMKQALGNKIRH